MARPITVTDDTFTERVVQSGLPVLVLFWAEWNATCKALNPSIDALAGEFEGRITVARCDVDANPVTPSLFGVMNVPQMLLFSGGQAVTRLVGYRRIEVIRAQVAEALAAV